MRIERVLLCLAILPALVVPAGASLMAVWDFGPDATNYTLVLQYEYLVSMPAITAGGASYDTSGGNGTTFTDTAGNIHTAGQCLHWNDVSQSGNNAYIILTVNTTGWKDMVIRWDYKSKNGTKMGPTSFDMDYEAGSGSWTNIVNNFAITRDGAWHQFSYDLSSIDTVDNQSSIQFRINDLDKNDLNGDYWQDNIQLTGTAIPEPFSAVLFALGGAVLFRRHRQ